MLTRPIHSKYLTQKNAYPLKLCRLFRNLSKSIIHKNEDVYTEKWCSIYFETIFTALEKKLEKYKTKKQQVTLN